MHLLDFLYPALLTITLHTLETDAARKPGNSVLLSNVQTLTLRKDLQTSHRRVSAIPQLRCVGGNAKGLYDVDIIRCKNQGADYDDQNIQWTCTASLPSDFKLGSTDVICEGYDSPDDPYILKGSCGVEYRLLLTDAGEERYGRGSGDTWDGFKRKGTIDWPAIIFWGIFGSVVAWMIYSAFIRDRPRGLRPIPNGGTGGSGGSGGGGDPGNDDPPPPYDYTSKPSSTPRAAPVPGEQARRPGFWSGAAAGGAAGAAAGYLAGNRGQQQSRNQGMWGNQQRDSFWNNDDPGEGSSGWGGGGRTTRPSGSGSGSSSFSSTRHESTGFGSTSRR